MDYDTRLERSTAAFTNGDALSFEQYLTRLWKTFASAGSQQSVFGMATHTQTRDQEMSEIVRPLECGPFLRAGPSGNVLGRESLV